MKKSIRSIILFYDNKGNILIQDRRKISKHGEEFGFFGGSKEGGETPEQTLKREIKEELSIDITNFKLFKRFNQKIEHLNLEVDRHFFIAPIPDLSKVEVKEGDLALMKIEDSFKLKMVPGDLELIEEVYIYLRNKSNNL